MMPFQAMRLKSGTGGGSPITYRSRLQFGGADASTTFTDDVGSNTWTAHSGTQIDTSLGDQRGLFSGGAHIRTATPALAFGTGDFKIAFIQRFANKSGYQTIVSRGYTNSAPGMWLLQTGNGDGLLNWYWSATGTGATLVAAEGAATININQDYLIEIERTGGTLTISRDGVVVASGADTNNYSTLGNFQIGAGSSVSDTQYPFEGWIKDFRVI